MVKFLIMQREFRLVLWLGKCGRTPSVAAATYGVAGLGVPTIAALKAAASQFVML